MSLYISDTAVLSKALMRMQVSNFMLLGEGDLLLF